MSMPVVDAARRLADDVLFPAAEAVDRSSVQRSSLDLIADAGLYAVAAPASYGGLDDSAADLRAVVESLAGGCGSTFFVWAQHHTPVRMLVSSRNEELRSAVLPDLCRGRRRAGVAFSYVRRPGPAAVVAERDGPGWRLTGEAPWVTGWDLVDDIVVAGLTDTGDIVFAWLPVDARGLAASPPLELAAMAATRTVRLRCDDVRVDDAAVVRVVDMPTWVATDDAATANGNPAVFGLTARALSLLADRAPTAAHDLRGRLARCRERSYELQDVRAPGDALDLRHGLRAEALDLALTATATLISAMGGAAMATDSPAQRLAREALFYRVQAQTAASRAASLGRIHAS
jgi:alkylation response protein AidB-like acyl-CoA dehydrogenase